MGSVKLLTQEDIEYAISRIEKDGADRQTIADELSVSRGCIQGTFSRLGLSPVKFGSGPKLKILGQEATVIALYLEGYSDRAIGKLIGVSKYRIGCFRNENNLPRNYIPAVPPRRVEVIK